MLQAVIFDMDGLMVDSEPFWQQAQLEIFPLYNVSITHQDTINTTGVRIDNIVEGYYAKQPWTGATQAQVCSQISARVIELIELNKPAMPGLKPLIQRLKTLDIKLAVASSSPMDLIEATLNALEITHQFDAVLSAQTLVYGKPHPEVYLNTAHALKVCPTKCLALEDSLTGLLAAKAARMKTIVIPETSQLERPQWSIADYKLASLNQVTLDMLSNCA
ncbi:hexitol phosphatase HxpB [Vibrio gallicus]|uniref:hexitol phosphatase HxpB n=1 Tax=Vibrio gallicus TaxID=190897 RepID=UPI0021C2B70F|nr:hexitol phosphatase HxpB [Vibrio gallicus]